MSAAFHQPLHHGKFGSVALFQRRTFLSWPEVQHRILLLFLVAATIVSLTDLLIVLQLGFARVYNIILIIDDEAVFLDLFYLLSFFLRGLQILVKFDSRLIFNLYVGRQINNLIRHLLLKVLCSLQVHLFNLLLHLLNNL